ncbi:peptidase S41 [Flavobacterium album]|uniref:Peptidase S41 n=1 Tax=Flavobacterium album TaxID=2175091 RepID=A0A2S1QTI2_9FLAO|nr:S41 family peptidase [Flavobacterium album]AWH83674.1 peptidase S41 [Flavobacterium album]
MRKFLLLLSVLIMQAALANMPVTETQKLEATARIWGFLKYYHPQVAAGKFNWDQKLIDILPEVEKVQTKEALSEVYIKWIDGLGEVPVCKKCGKPSKEELFEKNFSMAWMQDTHVFTDALTAKLKYIEANRHLGVSYYAGMGKADNIEIKNEPVYKDFEYPEKNYRLLSLFRYWNIIEYFFPYKYVTDQKWDDVLTEMIPKFKDAPDAQHYHLAMLELVAKINDSHGYLVTQLTNQYFGFYWAPVTFSIIDGKAVITGFYDEEKAKQDDLRIGDAITHVNGVAINDILKEKSRYIPASNPAVQKRDAYFSIFNGSSDKAEVTFERDGKSARKEITRYMRKEFKGKEKKPADKYKVLEGNIGYVNMGIIETSDVAAAIKKLSGCKAVIFDIRNYPQGTMYAFGQWLLPESRNFVSFIKPDVNYPGKYIWVNSYNVGPRGKNKRSYKGKVIVLVNETTQSHAEFTAMSLQVGDNVTTIGSQTAGADGNVTPFSFPGGYETWMTGLGVFYPDRTETQRRGVKVDVQVLPTIAGIKAGKDEVLEKAIELANE